MDALGREAFSEAYRYLKLFEEVSSIMYCSYECVCLCMCVCVCVCAIHSYACLTVLASIIRSPLVTYILILCLIIALYFVLIYSII